jgi:hypothetical protein
MEGIKTPVGIQVTEFPYLKQQCKVLYFARSLMVMAQNVVVWDKKLVIIDKRSQFGE